MASLTFRRSILRGVISVAIPATFAAWAAFTPTPAEACGCTSPPIPTPQSIDDFAVNQAAEQIIFEVGVDTVTAHVLIEYAGAPDQFAWIVPVPGIPDLGLSPSTAFAILNAETRPQINEFTDSICPQPRYACQHHAPAQCHVIGQGEGSSFTSFGSSGSDGTGDTGAEGSGETGTGGGAPPVVVEDMQIIGDYEVTTLSATSGAELVAWLQTNGFFVNDTMTPYMQPYLDDGMNFVAARLVPGAGVDSIKPLRMTYAGTTPMVPLRITAVAAEPHMPILTYVYAQETYQPDGHPLTEIPEDSLEFTEGRSNYPMVVSRAIDDAGGDAFVREFADLSPWVFTDQTGCCTEGSDWCGVSGNGQCECPRADFDQLDCADIPELAESIELLDRLKQDHSRVTRLLTRMSPEEMYFDPMFIPEIGVSQTPQRRVQVATPTLEGCESAVIDDAARIRIEEENQCATTYCGTGACALAEGEAGCECEAGQVARAYTEMDGLRGVTCVPAAHPVDYQLDPATLDRCASVDCGLGACVELGGFPTCRCDDGAVALLDGIGEVSCVAADRTLAGPGAEPFLPPLRALEVCALPAPTTCGDDGWLAPVNASIPGIMCEGSEPDPALLKVPPAPTCGGGEGCAGGCSSNGEPSRGWLSLGLLGLVGMRRRRTKLRRSRQA